MNAINDNIAAALDFGRSNFAANVGESKQSPCSLGAVPKSAKTFLPRIPLKSTTKQLPVFKGFFTSIAAVLRTKQAPNPAARKEWVSVERNLKVQLLQSDGLAANTRPGTCESKHVFPLMRGKSFLACNG